MVQTVRWRGAADNRVITAAQFSAAGLSSPTVTWAKSNGYEVVLDDPVAAYVLAQGNFELGDPNTKFGDLFDVPLRTNWGKDTLTSPVVWSPVTLTADGAQTTNWSITNKRLRFTSPTQGLGNMRSALLHPLANYKSAAVKSLWWGFDRWQDGNPLNTPQMGHIHNYTDVGGVKRMFMVWSNVFGTGPEVIQTGIWEISAGGVLTLGDLVTVGDMRNVTRRALVVKGEIIVFGVTIFGMSVVPAHAAFHMPLNGIPGTVTGMTNATMNTPSTQAFTSASRTSGVATLTYGSAHGRVVGQVIRVTVGTGEASYAGLHTITEVPTSTTLRYAQPGMANVGTATGTTQLRFVTIGGGSADSVIQTSHTASPALDLAAGGIWEPEYPGKVFPYWVKSWVDWVGGLPKIFVKQWAYGLPEPEDGQGIFTSGPLTVGQGATTLAPGSYAEGLHGVLGAHCHGGSLGEFDNVEILRRKAA